MQSEIAWHIKYEHDPLYYNNTCMYICHHYSFNLKSGLISLQILVNISLISPDKCFVFFFPVFLFIFLIFLAYVLWGIDWEQIPKYPF